MTMFWIQFMEVVIGLVLFGYFVGAVRGKL